MVNHFSIFLNEYFIQCWEYLETWLFQDTLALVHVWPRCNGTLQPQLPKSGSLDPRLKFLRWTSLSPKSPRISKNHQTSLNITQKPHSASQRNHPNISRSSSNSDPFRPLSYFKRDVLTAAGGDLGLLGFGGRLWRCEGQTAERPGDPSHRIMAWRAGRRWSRSGLAHCQS